MTGILCVNINSTKHRNEITHTENTRLNQGSNSEHFFSRQFVQVKYGAAMNDVHSIWKSV